MHIKSVLEQIPYFDNTEKLVAQKKNYFKILKFKNKEIIKYQGEKIEEVLIVVEGKVIGEYIAENGKSLEVDILEPYDIIAPGFIYSYKPFYPVNIIAEGKTTLLCIEKDNFLEILQTDKKLLLKFFQEIGDKFHAISQKLFLLSTKTLKEKVAYVLLKEIDSKGNVHLKMNKEKLSRFLGCARPALSRVFTELEKEGIIEQKGRNIRILKIEKLREFVKEV